MVAESKAISFPAKVTERRFICATLGFFGFLILFGACQQIDKKVGEQNRILKDQTTIPLPSITFLDSLTDSLQPQKIWLKDHSRPVPIYVPMNTIEVYNYQDNAKQSQFISPPQIIQRPYLKNDKGEAVFDDKGNHYYLGDGGISHFTTFTTDEGLGLDNITSSLLDRSGNLWFGTWGGGVSKFDGLSFTNFTTAHGLSNNLVHCLAEDGDGNIWIGTDGGGISIYDGYTFSNKTTSEGLANDIVYGITVDSKGNIWIAAGTGGATKYDGERFVNYNQANGLPGSSIIKIAEDRNGYIWFGTGNNGIVRFDGKAFMQFTTEDGLVENGIKCITKDKAGNLWIGTEGGVSKYQENADSTKKGTFINFTTSDGLGHDDIWDIEEDQQGNLWFATGVGGVSKFDGQKFTNYTTAQGLPEDVVYSISADGSGNLWFGTAGGGVALYKGAAFNNFTADLGLAKSRVYGILEDNSGNLWFGTDGGGVSKYDGKSFTNFNLDQGFPHPLVISTVKDKKGQLWFGTGGGGFTLYKDESIGDKHGSFTTFDSKNGFPSNVIYEIIEDRYGNLWIGTLGAGLVKFDWNTLPGGQSGFTAFTTAQGLANNIVYSILEDSNGDLWIGTAGGGVSRFNGKSFTNFTTAQGLCNDIVWSILEDKGGNIWFATQGGGISRFDGQSFSNFTTREGLVDDTVYDLLEDTEGNIFIGTNRGFTVIPARVASLSFQEMSGSLEYYNTSNGYPVKDVNKGMYLDSQGDIWSGNGSEKTGLVKFNYQALRKKKHKPVIKIKSISINEQPIGWISLQSNATGEEAGIDSKSLAYITDEVRIFGRKLSLEERKSQQKEFSKIQFSDIRRFENFPENLKLPYSQNQLTITFGTDELVRPNLMEYRYILEGSNKSWSPVLKNNSANFGNVREGDYVFKVITRYTGAAEAEGKEWSEEAVFRFSVLPPWHRTWWAYLIYLIILLAVSRKIYVLQRSRTIRKERDRIQQKELEQAKEIEKAYLELQKTQAQLIQSEKMASLGELTAGIAHEIQNPLNFVNNFSEVSSELVDETLEELEAVKTRHALYQKKDPYQDKESLAEITNLLGDIKQNLEKINHHGKRADAIVKGMLQHSRSSTGTKEPTDINALVDEYLRLSYHAFLSGRQACLPDRKGLRAKDKSFNAAMETDYDASIGSIDVIPQDIGRVVLNLINNAFYAVAEASAKEIAVSDYKPTVSVSTKKYGKQVTISVKDNGPGIPDAIKDKIFQPFFTTKPTGQGTGLGLSLSYDIIKAHGGEIKVESLPTGEAGLPADEAGLPADEAGNEEVGTQFTIKIPIA